MNELFQLLRQLEAARFYGSVEVKFEAGQVTVIKKTESIKPAMGDPETIEVTRMNAPTLIDGSGHNVRECRNSTGRGGGQ